MPIILGTRLIQILGLLIPPSVILTPWGIPALTIYKPFISVSSINFTSSGSNVKYFVCTGVRLTCCSVISTVGIYHCIVLCSPPIIKFIFARPSIILCPSV